MKFNNARTGSVLRKAVLCSAAVALSAALVPAAALAADAPTYTLPTKAMSIQKVQKDSKGNTYTVDGLSVCAAQPPMQMPFYSLLGINNTMQGRASGQPTTSAQNGLFGSDANVSPDPYLYNYCASLNGATVASDAMINSASTMTVTIDGTDYNMPRDIYMETTIIQSTADTASGDYTYAEWVKLENKRPNRTKTTTYDPTFVKFNLNTGGTYTLTESLFSMAEQADEIIEGSKDANGNYTYSTRYAEGANTWRVAGNYEDIIKGSQYYLLSLLDSGVIKEKATVAVICGYDDETGAYAVRKLDINEDDINSNAYGGRIAGAVCTIATDMNDLGLPTAQDAYVGETSNFGTVSTLDENEYVAWYTAEQIVENCDAALITDAYEGNAQKYLAHDSEGHQRTVYENIEKLTAAQASARAAGKKAADICVNWPQSLFGCYYAQGCENVMLTLVGECFLYPEYYDLTDMMAWWAKNVWHITDASLQDMVDSTCYNVSLSTNQSKIGTISANFEEEIDGMINLGNNYYLENYETIDALSHGNIKTHSMDMLKARTTILQDQTIKLSPASKTVKTSAKKQTVAVTVKGAQGKVTATVNAKAKKAGIKVKATSKKVTVTLPAKVKKGTYKISVTAAGTYTYKAAKAKNITIKVK